MVYEKPMLQIENICSESAVADVETLVSATKINSWNGLFNNND